MNFLICDYTTQPFCNAVGYEWEYAVPCFAVKMPTGFKSITYAVGTTLALMVMTIMRITEGFFRILTNLFFYRNIPAAHVAFKDMRIAATWALIYPVISPIMIVYFFGEGCTHLHKLESI